jgi:hypothetical protein
MSVYISKSSLGLHLDFTQQSELPMSVDLTDWYVPALGPSRDWRGRHGGQVVTAKLQRLEPSGLRLEPFGVLGAQGWGHGVCASSHWLEKTQPYTTVHNHLGY